MNQESVIIRPAVPPLIPRVTMVNVSVRMDFLHRLIAADGTEDITFGLGINEHEAEGTNLVRAGGGPRPLGNVKVEILNTNRQALTNNLGQAQLNTDNIADGDYTIRITPQRHTQGGVTIDLIDSVRNWPELEDDLPIADLPDLLFRKLDVTVHIINGGLASVIEPYDAAVGATHGRLGNRVLHSTRLDQLPIDLRPVWWRDPNDTEENRLRPTNQLHLIVIHCTSGHRIGRAINGFLETGKSIHYLVDRDGHVVKMMRDDRKIAHVGTTVTWKGEVIAGNSIGIENVHDPTRNEPYPDDQLASLLGLVKRLLLRYASIEVDNVVGHCDVQLGSGRILDPGPFFDWPRFERANVGMQPSEVPPSASDYGGFFGEFPEESLENRDRDSPPALRRYGGANGPQTARGPASIIPKSGTSAPVQELRQELKDIGYNIQPGSIFDEQMQKVANAFQAHFFAGSRGGAMTGRVDARTAGMIKSLAVAARGA